MYSQRDEEEMIQAFFKRRLPRYKYFVDIGAHDGVFHSNTRRLYELGWKGLLVEPNPQSFIRLGHNYKDSGCRLLNCGIGSDDYETLQFYAPKGLKRAFRNLEAGELTTAAVGELAKWKTVVTGWEVFTARMRTLKDILTSCSGVDFLSIDCEGMDYEVIKSADLSSLPVALQPLLITIEKGSRSSATWWPALLELMRVTGYEQVGASAINTLWGRK